jgi:hypothetical protein
MAFGRRKRDQDPQDRDDSVAADVEESVESVESAAEDMVDDAVAVPGLSGDADGPFDIEDFDDPAQATLARLDLGSVLIPMQPDGQVQVELNQMGVPSAIWIVTGNGRFTIAAYAAPKTPGLWREVAGELADALRNDNAAVSIQNGPWGREVVGTGAGVVRFIGVDGYRWMIRCVVNGLPASIDALAAEAREAMADTVVRRGDTPLPVRTPLPVQLPEPLAAQLNAAAVQQAQQAQLAQQAMFAAQQAMVAQQQQQPQPDDPAGEGGVSGSATQQFRTTSSTGG